MVINSRHFGEIEIDENGVIDFPNGILAFEDVKKYIIINNPDPEIPFQWLQSIDKPELAFVLANPFLFKENYEFNIPDKVTNKLEVQNIEDISIYSIAVITDDISDMTINLKGPIIINNKNNTGCQIILESDEYELKHKIFEKKE